jgi:hypothetical protein
VGRSGATGARSGRWSLSARSGTHPTIGASTTAHDVATACRCSTEPHKCRCGCPLPGSCVGLCSWPWPPTSCECLDSSAPSPPSWVCPCPWTGGRWCANHPCAPDGSSSPPAWSTAAWSTGATTSPYTRTVSPRHARSRRSWGCLMASRSVGSSRDVRLPSRLPPDMQGARLCSRRAHCAPHYG